MNLYIIGGKAKNGKNTFSKLIKEELKTHGYEPCIMHLTEPLYTYARNHFEWDEYSNEKPREFLQKMGIEIIKEKLGKKTFLLDRLVEDIEILSNFFDTFIITDARLKMEFEYLKEKFPNTTTIKLERDNFDNGLSENEKQHLTEVDLDDYNDFDYKIKNTNITDLKKAAKKIVFAEVGEKNE